MEKGKFIKMALTGNEAYAYAMKQINPDVVAAYPITPATEIVQIFSKYVADGLVDTEFVPVESEHSALSACVGASVAGARVMTGTASQGLALMHEVLYIAAGLRLPIVMAVVNRALSAPINIHGDQSDTMGSRDSGWIQIYTENADEAYHSVIMAVKIAETVNLPAMVMLDGFIISHEMEVVNTLPDEAVKEFIGERKPLYNLFDFDNPVTVGPLDLQDYYFEHKRQQMEAMFNAKKVIPQITKEYNEKFGTNIPAFVEPYRLEDAEYAVVAMSSAAGTMKEIIDQWRDKGEKVGLLRLRITRPFPFEEIRKHLGGLKAVGVMDRAESHSTQGGPMLQEIKAALYDLESRPKVTGFVFGLGGRDFDDEQANRILTMIKDLKDGKELPLYSFIGVRE